MGLCSFSPGAGDQVWMNPAGATRHLSAAAGGLSGVAGGRSSDACGFRVRQVVTRCSEARPRLRTVSRDG